MKSIYTKCLLAAAAAAFAGTVNAQQSETIVVSDDTPVYVKTEGMPAYLAARIEREAQKGLQPLRQYVERTKFIHQLDLVSLLMTREQARLAKAQNDKIQLVEIAQN